MHICAMCRSIAAVGERPGMWHDVLQAGQEGCAWLPGSIACACGPTRTALLLLHQAVKMHAAAACLTPTHAPVHSLYYTQERRHTLRSFAAYADWVKEVHFSGERLACVGPSLLEAWQLFWALP